MLKKILKTENSHREFSEKELENLEKKVVKFSFIQLINVIFDGSGLMKPLQNAIKLAPVCHCVNNLFCHLDQHGHYRGKQHTTADGQVPSLQTPQTDTSAAVLLEAESFTSSHKVAC